MAARRSPKERVLQMVRQRGVLRPRDLDQLGIPREYLRRLLAEGLLERPGRGLYVPADADTSEREVTAEACRRIPHGVVCLLSALRFHDLTTQSPHQVWMAISSKARLPKVDYPPMRFVRFSGSALSHGIEIHTDEAAEVRVYNPAKTVVDCFKYRNKIGLDVALEALRDCWSQRKATMDELWQAAKICRMTNVMRPYLEALV